MNEKLRKMLDEIKAKKQEVLNMCEAGNVEAAKKAKEELKALQEKFDLLYDLEEEALDEAKNQVKTGEVNALNKKSNVEDSFVNVIKAAVKGGKVAEEDKEILNAMKEGADEDGGLLVPKDIQTSIKGLRRSEDALETLVNVENVKTLSGSRVIEKKADQTPFDNVEEEADFPEVPTPQFENIDYKVKKKGGILRISEELLADTSENVMAYLRRWISKKAKATRNFLIIKKIREITKDGEVAVKTLDDLKRIFNVILDPVIELSSVIVTNQDGYNWLDTLKDSEGKYALQKDPMEPMKKLLFGKYPVIKVSNLTLKSVQVTGGYKAPFICGDLKEAVTLFDRENMTIDISKVAGDLWKKDQTGIKVRERLDIKGVDTEAVVMAEVLILTDKDKNGKYSKEELEELTKQQILDLAAAKQYVLTATIESKKEEIITEFLQKQG